MPVLDGFGPSPRSALHERTKIPARAHGVSRRGRARNRAFEGLEAGADDYLVKPFTAWRELLARVEAHLFLARMRAEAGQGAPDQ